MKKTKSILSIVAIAALALTGCQKAEKDPNTVNIGTISGPETELMEVAKKIAIQKYNVNINIIEFSDYSTPNAALDEGSLDANAFQTKAFMDNEMNNKHYKLAIIGNTFVYPMAIYSEKYKNIKDVPDNAIVAIPNDASNEARALILLSKAGLITLKSENDINATAKDITSNPKHLEFKELDAAQLPRALPDVAISVINTNYALPAGLSPTQDAIFVEDKTSPYVNLIVSRQDNANDPRLQSVVKAYQSAEVKEKAESLFKGHAVVGW
jgi:D-methionine transport system substrate-binding protein